MESDLLWRRVVFSLIAMFKTVGYHFRIQELTNIYARVYVRSASVFIYVPVYVSECVITCICTQWCIVYALCYVLCTSLIGSINI